jgi:hypothetical protein
MLAAPTFRRKPRVSAFLEHAVRETLDGNEIRLKEYSIAVSVFGRPEDFDPRMDSIVRVEARRLRQTVDIYYSGEGAEDTVFIQFRRGTYVPVFLPHRRADLSYAQKLAAGAGGLMVGVLAGADGWSTVAGRSALAQATMQIMAPPFDGQCAHLISQPDSRVFLLRAATEEDVATLLDAAERL